MCALKWYIKSLYRHIFLEDISKHARVTHFLLFVKPNSHAHWPTCTKRGSNVAKGNSCKMTEVKKNSREPPLRYRVEKRRDHGIGRKIICCWARHLIGIRCIHPQKYERCHHPLKNGLISSGNGHLIIRLAEGRRAAQLYKSGKGCRSITMTANSST